MFLDAFGCVYNGFGYDEAVRFVGSKRGDISPVPNLAFSIEDCIGFYL